LWPKHIPGSGSGTKQDDHIRTRGILAGLSRIPPSRTCPQESIPSLYTKQAALDATCRDPRVSDSLRHVLLPPYRSSRLTKSMRSDRVAHASHPDIMPASPERQSPTAIRTSYSTSLPAPLHGSLSLSADSPRCRRVAPGEARSSQFPLEARVRGSRRLPHPERARLSSGMSRCFGPIRAFATPRMPIRMALSSRVPLGC
jgi:hypothetical protein